jgi:hypothetical protein
VNLRSAQGELVDKRTRPPLIPAVYLLLQIVALGGLSYLLASLFG